MGVYDLVKFEGVRDDWLLYKFPGEEFNTKSKLVISPGQVAIVVHDGKIEKILENGSFVLNSELLPFVKGLQKSIFSGNNPYPLEIYFINKKLKLDFLWGTSDPIDIIDPIYGIKLRMRARGQFGLKLDNYQYFFQTLVGTLQKNNYITFDAVRSFFRGFINQKIRVLLTTEFVQKKITYFEISMHLDEIQQAFEGQLKPELEKYGFLISSLSIETIDTPEEDLESLNKILHKKTEMDQLGDTGYRTVRGYDVLEEGAKNNSGAGTIMGVGMGMQMGNAVGAGGGIIPPAGESSKAATIECPKCKAKIPADAKFCPECGAKILHECPKCGAKVSPKQKFCPECGEKLYE